MYSKAIRDLIKGASLYNVWSFQAWHEISAKYKRTVLGSLWIAGGMVALSLSLAVVFGAIMRQNMHDIFPNIIGGILCYGFCAFILIDSPEIFMGAAGMIKNHAYPYTYYVFESLCRATLMFLNNVIVFFIAIACVGALAVPHWSFLIGFPIVLVTLFTWGTVLGLAASRFRDLRFMTPLLSQILFFLTPVTWMARDVGPDRRFLIDFNPYYGLVEIMRAPLLGYAAPMQAYFLALTAMGLGIFVWLIVFSACRRKIPFWI